MKRFLTALFLSFSLFSWAAKLPPVKLKCEYEARPLGLDVLKPRLSWQNQSPTRNAKQTAYQILVASTEENLKTDNGDVWNSGKVMGDQSLWIDYKGKPLESRKRYFWKVKVWDEKAQMSTYSENAWWEMGLLNKTDWLGHWIGMAKTEGKPPRSVELQREFNLDKRAIRARIYVTGLGAYHLVFNGKKVGNDFLTPGWTHYLKTLNYQTYDVTEQVNTGANFITATLGNSWWSGGLGWGGGAARYSEGPCRLMFQLVLDFYDGSTVMVSSDDKWKVRLSPITQNTLYNGETYDARLEYSKDWAAATILDNVSNKPMLFPPDKDYKTAKTETDTLFSTANLTLKSSVAPQIQIMEEIKAISVKEVKKGRYVFDFGQNLVGFAHLKVEGKAGKEITLKFAELLNEKGFVAQENLRSAKATDTYITKGYGVEEWEPKFTYHGFRYVEMEGFPGKTVDASTLVAKVTHNAAPMMGDFKCSDDLLNKIQQNIFWGQRGNMMSVPTDCPQRDERLGWMGDAQVFGPTASYNRDMNGFFAKWVRDISDSQHPSGYVYDVNPKIVVGGPSKPAWGDALLVVPATMYQFYGDKRILEENYEAMKAWVNYMNNHPSTQKTGLYVFQQGDFYGYGDWVPAEKSPTKPIGAIYQCYSNRLLADAAKVLGKTADAQQYTTLALQFTDKYNKLYFHPNTNQYEGATQTMNLLPVGLGLAPEGNRAAIIGNVADNVNQKDKHLSTGFLGTGQLLPRLCDYGFVDLAYKVATQKTYPSWGYMIDKGATTMWELWNSDKEKPEEMNSRNHFAYGSVGEWYYGYLAGIRPDTKVPAFKRFVIAPKIPEGLTWVESSYESPYGTIKVRWDKAENGKFTLNLETPANTIAEIHLPTFAKAKPIIKEGGKVQKIKTISKDEAVIEVGSGKYLYEVE